MSKKYIEKANEAIVFIYWHLYECCNAKEIILFYLFVRSFIYFEFKLQI